MKAYIDSCVAIYFIEGPVEVREAVAAAFRTLDEEPACISDMVRFECRIGVLRRDDLLKLDEYRRFFDRALLVPLGGDVFDLASELRATHNLRTPDAIHAAAAITHGCDELWTNDRRLAAIEGRIRLRVLP